MTRIIKFRCWDNRLNVWSVGANRALYWEELEAMFQGEDPEKFMSHNVSDGQDLTLEQFTGLKDRNGKEIYEGDIVLGGGNYTQDDNQLTKKGLVVEMEYGNWSPFDDGSGEYGYESNKSEIIGNIHENPELLS